MGECGITISLNRQALALSGNSRKLCHEVNRTLQRVPQHIQVIYTLRYAQAVNQDNLTSSCAIFLMSGEATGRHYSK